RLEQLGIYVDEAHHSFGKTLAKDMGIGAKETDTSLRTTIDILAASLNAAGTRVVACYNYTGTPYVGREVLPEVVYAYGLKEAIDKGFLKKVTLHGYANTRTDEFIDVAVETFLKESGDLRPEGLLPKLAFFASTIEELTAELKPAVERALLKHGIPTSRILVNVGDSKLTTNDDIREFNRLDTESSDKQFILLVNKGREGWNCRSLFGVGLFREPKSKIFVLQATMRCLRAIGQAQYTGHVFLSDDNLNTLNDELQQNFRISADELQKVAKDKERVEVRVVAPPVKIKLVRIRKQYQMREKLLAPGQPLGLDRTDRESWNELVEKYRLIETQQDGLTAADVARASGSRTFDLTSRRLKRSFSRMTLVAEVSRYLNRSPLEIEELLDSTQEGTDELVAITNEFNELLYDEIIPRLFRQLYDLDESQQTEEHEVDLIKVPTSGYYEVSAAKDKVVRMNDAQIQVEERTKSFHLDTYCFDSGSENWLFWDLLREQRVKKIYFTGMLTHGQSDFFIQYIDPESRTVRSYYPDFIFLREEPDGSLKYVIVEVKADNQIEDAVVQAKKDFAQQIAVASGMEYRILKSSDADKRRYRLLL
ncbi:TnsA endonuclease N-terminal domain-containing protein, partial [Pseudomonas coronafaciens]